MQSITQILNGVRIAPDHPEQEPPQMRGVALPEDVKPPEHQVERFRGPSIPQGPTRIRTRAKYFGDWDCGTRRSRSQSIASVMEMETQIKDVEDSVCKKHSVDKADVFGKSRLHKFTKPRHEVWYELVKQEIVSNNGLAKYYRRDLKTINGGIVAHVARLDKTK